MSEQQIQAIYSRLDNLTNDVNNLKIQAGTIGTSQVAIAQNLTLTLALSSEVRELKADMREVKSDVQVLKSDIAEIKTDIAGIQSQLAQILVILQNPNT